VRFDKPPVVATVRLDNHLKCGRHRAATNHEEITMLPYQIYQALTDERVRELMAEARRHDLATAARHTSADRSGSSPRLRRAAGRILDLLRIRHAHARPATSSAAGAGPMGCVA
jgi:hypothetical protein